MGWYENLKLDDVYPQATSMATHLYSELELRKLKGQALKDVWHAMIGKEAGIKNTTGLKNSEEILQAILLGQANKEYLNQFLTRQPHKQKEPPVKQEEDPEPMRHKQPKESKESKESKQPKVKPNPILVPQGSLIVKSMAVESMEPIEKNSEVHRICLKKIHIGDKSYFVDKATQTVYSIDNNRPGSILGRWNQETNSISIYDV